MGRDFYSFLGVSRFASQDALRRAFRSRILRVHPDRNPDDEAAADRARRVIEAYHVLGNPESRRQYDRALATPTWAVVAYHRRDAACPLWVTRCFVLVLFFAVSAGLFYAVTEAVADSTPVFRPILGVTNDYTSPASSVSSTTHAARGDHSPGFRFQCLQEVKNEVGGATGSSHGKTP